MFLKGNSIFIASYPLLHVGTAPAFYTTPAFYKVWWLLRRRCGKFGRISTTKGVLRWEANVGIAEVRAMAVAASTARTRHTSIATTRSTANGAAAQATGAAAYMLRTRCIGTVRAETSASGAARRRMAPAAYIRRRVATKSRKSLWCNARRSDRRVMI